MKGSIDMEKKLVPVTLLTGYLGAGKGFIKPKRI